MIRSRSLLAAALAALALTACGGGAPSSGETQAAPDNQIEAPAPNEGNPDIEQPDAGST